MSSPVDPVAATRLSLSGLLGGEGVEVDPEEAARVVTLGLADLRLESPPPDPLPATGGEGDLDLSDPEDAPPPPSKTFFFLATADGDLDLLTGEERCLLLGPLFVRSSADSPVDGESGSVVEGVSRDLSSLP